MTDEWGESRPRSRLIVIASVSAVVVLSAIAAGLAFNGSDSAETQTATSWLTTPLSTSFVTASGTWVIVPMGDLDQPLNTFWQMFFLPDGKQDWSLVTPPGVADNGGLAASVAPGGGVAVAFDPTDLLTFSPVAFTSDDGKSWSSGVMPFGAATLPDSLVYTSSSGQLDAIAADGAKVESGNTASPTWLTLYTRSDLARSAPGRSCGVGTLTALVPARAGLLVGTSCNSPGEVGIFSGTASGSSWTTAGPDLPASNGDLSVIRLSAGEGGSASSVAIVDARHGSSSSILGLWQPGGTGSWLVSAPLPIEPHASIVSTGFGANGTFVIETSSQSGHLSADKITPGSGSKWSVLPSLPSGTQDVSLDAGGSIDALTVSISQFTDWRLEGSVWKKDQTIDVPIQYGSSG
jgi:hypothetical protein